MERGIWGPPLVILAIGCGPSPSLIETPEPVAELPRVVEDRADEPSSSSKTATPVAVECPPETEKVGTTCVATKVVCPGGSHKVGDDCVGDVVCPADTFWTGLKCAPKQSAAPVAELPKPCPLRLNSIPASNVFVDGKPVGRTPLLEELVSAGKHTVVFAYEEGVRKRFAVTCKDGESKNLYLTFPTSSAAAKPGTQDADWESGKQVLFPHK